MPNTAHGSSTPAANLIAQMLEGKSRVGAKVGRFVAGAGGGIIDSLGRRWNSALHPRDARGRFIETGGIASIPALGVRGKVVRALGNGRIELLLKGNKRKAYPAAQVMMVTRPDGSKPLDAPDDENSPAFKKAVKLLNDEDERRELDPKRGDGVDADDEGDWDGDGILNEKDDTPLGEKKPAKGKKRKGGKDTGDGYTLHSKAEGGESADTNHELEDAEGNIIGTVTSGVPRKNSWRGQVNGTPVTADNEHGWVLAAKRTHARQKARPATAPAATAAQRPARPKQEITPAHKEERDALGEPGRVAYDLARHGGKNHVQAMGEGEAADRTRRAAPAADADAPAPKQRDDSGTLFADEPAAAPSRQDQRRQERADTAASAEASAKAERDRSDAAVNAVRDDADPAVQDAIRRYDETNPENRLALRKNAREVQDAVAAKADAKPAREGDDENDGRTQGGRPETDQLAETDEREPDEAKREQEVAGAERQSDASNVRDNGDSTTPTEGETREQPPALRDDRGAALADVPAVAGGDDAGPDGVLPQPGRAGGRRGGAGDAGSAGAREGGSAGRGDAPADRRSDAVSGEGDRGNGAGRAGVPDAGARDGEPSSRGSDVGRVGPGARDNDGVAAPKGRNTARKNAAKATSRFKPGSQDDLAPAGEAAKVEANMAALRLLRKLDAEDRPATADEQRVLARWAGWGALPDVFDERKPKYAAVRDELETLLSPREWDDAQDNVLNAHYTDAAIVKEAWKALDELGFTGGDVLEPGSGVGNFIGLAPKGARMHGIEVDPVTAAISQHLYPDAEIHHESFGDSPIRSNAFDAVVGNVPFGNFPVADKKHNPGNRMSIHNHFIAKGVDALKPGGVMAVLTSQWTLDGRDQGHKTRIAAQADLIGAVRLPSGTHKAAAGTDVVTDLLVFRKRKDGEVPGDRSWMETVGAVDKDGQPVLGIARKGEEPKQQQISAYFQSHPENMLGDLRSGGYNGSDLRANGDTTTQMRERLAKIASDAKDSGRGWDPNTETVTKRAVGDLAESRITHKEVKGADGKPAVAFEIIEDGVPVELKVDGDQQKDQLRRLLDIGDLTRQLLDRESDAPEGDPVLEDYRARLNRAYDDYVAKYGAITQYTLTEQIDKVTGEPKRNTAGELLAPRRNTPPVMGKFRRDLISSSEVFALEKSYDPTTKKAVKSDLFEKRQVNPGRTIAEHADTPETAVALLNERGEELTWKNLAKVLDVPESKIKALAGDAVFEVPGSKGKLSHKAEYLSDNVRKKLAEAEKAAETDPRFERNVDALRAVVPPDADLSEMPLQLGADWIEPHVLTAFGRHLMKQSGNGMQVDKDYLGNWQVKRPASGSYNRNGALEFERWGTDRRSFYDLMLSVLKQQHRSITVKDKDSEGNEYVNKEATDAAREKALEIAAEFENWAFSDARIAESLTKAYSERFRAIVPRSYDNSPRRAMPGMTDEITLLQHQNDAVTRAVNEPSVLFEHVVGAGKTFTLAGSIMELRRLGLAKKPVLAVPNHMLGQWTSEFKELYPNAKILAADSSVLEGADGRRRFAALARNSDWDVVLMTHTAFESIPVSREKLEDYLGGELARMREGLSKAKADGNEKTFKQIQTQIKKKEAKLAKQLEARKDDDGVTFEGIGFDYIAVDEAHAFKNLDFSTGMDGVQAPEGANRARDMHMKVEVVRGDDPKKHTVAFATGTPISNTLSEMYTMTRFLRPDLLEDANVADFDSWAATFAKVESKLETNTAGNGYVERTRMRGFTDALGDGLRLWRTFSDTKSIEDLPWIKRPKVKGGERKVHVVEQSELHGLAMGSFKNRVEMLPSGRAEKGDDTHVAIIGDGRRAAIDPRLMSARGLAVSGIDPSDDSYGVSPKIAKAANEIANTYANTKDNEYLVRPLRASERDGDVPTSPNKGALQMVMLDSSSPASGKLNAYQMLKDELVARGVPAEGIRFIQNYKTADQKAKLFEEARQGKVAVLMGSTDALGTGTNVQNRLYALHHIDGSWKPSAIEQREGRILRQGNQHDEVEINVYATKGTHDIKTWDMTAYKQHVLDAMKQGDYDMRGVEFADDVDPLTDFDTIAGMTSENPLVADRRDVEQALKKLQKSAGRHAQAVELANSRAERSRMEAFNSRNAAKKIAEQLPSRVDTKGDAFSMTLKGAGWDQKPETFGDRKDAAIKMQSLLVDTIDGHLRQTDGSESYEHTIGHIGGFPVRYFRRKGFDGKPVGVLRLGPANSPEYRNDTIPVKPVEFTKADLRDNPTGLLQRLENRVSSMDDQIAEYNSRAEFFDGEARESAENALRGFAGAQDLMDAQRRKQLLDKMLAVDPDRGESVDSADMAEYEALNRAAVEREAAEKAARAAALAAKKAEKAGVKPEKVQATDAEKATAARDLSAEIAKARAEKRATTPDQGALEVAEPDSARPRGRAKDRPATAETVTVEPEEVAKDMADLGLDLPAATPSNVDAPKPADAPEAPAADVRTPDEDGLVQSVNEGQLDGQTRLGGEDFQSQITEDFMLTQEAPTPKVKPEPVAAPEGPSLFDEPEAPAVPEAPNEGTRSKDRTDEPAVADAGDGSDSGDTTPSAPSTPDEPEQFEAPIDPLIAEDVPEPADADLPDTDEDLNVVPEPDEITTPGAPERLDGEKFDPTPQQQQVYDAALSGKDVVIQAKAGAGKTSTLEGLARRIERDNPDDKIAYVAFNKSVQVEAQGRMPKNVEPRTGHSVAFAWASDELKERFDSRGLRRPDEIARHLGINEDMKVPGEKALSPKEQAMAVVRALDTFANSADDEIDLWHLPERMQGLPSAEKEALLRYADKGWKDLLDAKGGKLNLTLDHMRKMWALSKPDFTKAGSGLKRRATVLFLDEAQDTPPVLAKVIADQKMRKVIVGDADQAIYGFTGATDYLSTALSDVELPLTKSFRFGPQVADWGNRFLQMLGSKGRVEGAGPASKIVGGMKDADAILVRSNGGMIGEIMRELDNGRTVGVPKGTKKDLLSLVETARYLKGEGGMPERLHDDLAPFRTWAEVADEAQKGDDAKIKMLARIVGEHGVDKLDEIVQQVIELGDDGLSGVEFENMDHGLVARGKTFGIKDDLKAAGFRWMEVPGETITAGPNKGQPLKAWTAAGDEATREARLAKVREANAGPTPDVVVSTAHKAKGLEWDRVKIGDDFQGPKQDPATGKMIMPSDDENRLAYVAVTRAQKELDPGSLSWVEDYTDANGGTPGAKPAVKVDADAIAQDLNDLGVAAPEPKAPAVAEAAPSTPKVDTTPTPLDADEADDLGDGTPDPAAENARLDAISEHAYSPEVTEKVAEAERKLEDAKATAVSDVSWSRNAKGNLVGEYDGWRVEVTSGSIGVNKLGRDRVWNPEGEDVTPEWAFKTGMIPNGATTKAEAEEVWKQHMARGLQGILTMREHRARVELAKAKHEATPALDAPDTDGLIPGKTPASEDGLEPSIPADRVRPGTKVDAFYRHPTNKPAHSQYHDGVDVEDGTFLGLDGNTALVRDADGTVHRVTGERSGHTDPDVMPSLRPHWQEQAPEVADDDAPEVDAPEAEVADAPAARDLPDYTVMSDEDLMDAWTKASMDLDEPAMLAAFKEMEDREEREQAWGTPYVERPKAPAKKLTKAEQERQWQDELHDANLAVLLPFYRKSGHAYSENATPDDARQMLDGLDESGKTALLNGNAISRKRLAKMSEESTMALWGMTPDEMRNSPTDHSTLSIPGAIKKADWFEDKKAGGNGLGSDDHDRDEKDRLGITDPEDLTDDQLDLGIDHSRKDKGDDQREELLVEKVARDKQDDATRAAKDADRERRRKEDDEDDSDVPDGDVRDLTDRELEDRIKDHEDDDDEDAKRDRGEKVRRDRLSDDEREEEERKRRRRRKRRDRRRSRRRRDRNKGGRGKRRPRLRMPHLDLPHLDDDKDRDRIPGNTKDAERELAARDAKSDPDTKARDLAGIGDKKGSDLTPEEREQAHAAMDAAYGDPTPDMDAFVAAEDLPEGGVPGSGTVGGKSRDELDVLPGNEQRFNGFLRAKGEPVDGQKVTDAASLREVLGDKYADKVLEGKTIPASYAGKRLSDADARNLFGMDAADLKAKGIRPVRWVGAQTPEGAVVAAAKKPSLPSTPETAGTPAVPAPTADLPARDAALANPDARGWSQPMSPAEVKVGDVILAENRYGTAEVVTDVKPTTQRGEPGAIISTDNGSRGFNGESKPVRVNAERALSGKKGKPSKADLAKMDEAAKSTMTEERQAKRDAAVAEGFLPETDADGYYPASGDPAEIPVGPYGMDEGQMHALVRMKLSDAPVFVTGVTKEGVPFMGEPKEIVRETGSSEGVVRFEGPSGEFFIAGPQVASMRLVAGEVAMPGAPVLATRLRPGSRAVVQNMGRASLSQGPGAKVEVDPDGSIHMATGRESRPGARSTLGTPDAPRTMHPLERRIGAPSDVTPEGAPERDVQVVPDAPATPDAVDAPQAPEAVEAPEAPAVPEAPSASAGAPEADVPEAEDTPEAPADVVPDDAPATVRPMGSTPAVQTAIEPITGRKPDWVTPDALQIGDFARVSGKDEKGGPADKSGYLANDPQPIEYVSPDGEVTDVLAVLLSEEMDGLGDQTAVFVPLDRMAALAPRPESDDVVADGEQVAANKLDVRNGRMPRRIPTDSKGKLGLFPRSIVQDVDGQRQGIVIASRGDDVSVRWANDEVEDVRGDTLTITDGGIARADGWTVKGEQITPQRSLTTPDPAKQDPIRVEDAVQDELVSVAQADTDDLIDALGKALDGSKPMSAKEFERTLQAVVRKHMRETEARRVQVARRVAAQRPYEAGLLTKVIAALGLLALSIAAAIIAALVWLSKRDNQQMIAEHLALAKRSVRRSVKSLPEFERLNRLVGITDDAPAGGVDDLVDALGGAR